MNNLPHASAFFEAWCDEINHSWWPGDYYVAEYVRCFEKWREAGRPLPVNEFILLTVIPPSTETQRHEM